MFQDAVDEVVYQDIKAWTVADLREFLVDELSPTDGDYLDVGRPLFDGRTVPVVIKSLVFGA